MSAIHHRLACIALAAAGAAAHAETGPYYIGGQLGYTHQSNVLGLADGQAVPAPYKAKGDDITSLALVGGVNQTVGRQRVFGDITVSNNRYAENTILDNTSHALTAGVDWETAGNLSGKVTLGSRRELFSYSSIDQPTGVKNLVTSRQADALARLGGVTFLTFEGGVGYRSTDYGDAAFDARDNRQSYWLAGVKVRPAAGASLGLAHRDTRGRNPRFRDLGDGAFEADRLDRQDIDLTGYLEFSGVTNVFARLSRSTIDYDIQNDFSGWTGLLRGTWLPTGKLRFTAEAARDRGQDLRYVLDFDLVNGPTEAETAQLVTTWRATASYQLSEKVALNANLAYTRQPVAVSNVGGADDGRLSTRRVGLGATWQPTRTSSIGCNLSHQRRASDVLSFLDQSSNVFGCFGQITLQP